VQWHGHVKIVILEIYVDLLARRFRQVGRHHALPSLSVALHVLPSFCQVRARSHILTSISENPKRQFFWFGTIT
jgi:hypothetical protein